MHKFGDTCRYIRNGEEMNAIVLGAREIEGVEHLTVCYPNKDIAGQMLTAGNVAKATLVDFDVKPMEKGANRGWRTDVVIEVIRKATPEEMAQFNMDADPGVALPGTKTNENQAIHETKQYADGNSVTGTGPAPTAKDYAEIPGLKEAEESFIENMKADEQKAKEATAAAAEPEAEATEKPTVQ
jgi:hypothetical protein